MTVASLDIASIRRRFSALQTPLAFFDGPGGTQVPDEVIDAIADYLRGFASYIHMVHPEEGTELLRQVRKRSPKTARVSRSLNRSAPASCRSINDSASSLDDKCGWRLLLPCL